VSKPYVLVWRPILQLGHTRAQLKKHAHPKQTPGFWPVYALFPPATTFSFDLLVVSPKTKFRLGKKPHPLGSAPLDLGRGSLGFGLKCVPCIVFRAMAHASTPAAAGAAP